MAEFTTTYTVDCPGCGSGRVIKVGKRSGHQRYKCRGCQKKFRDHGMAEGRKFESEWIGAAIRDYYMGMSYKQIAEAMVTRYDIPEPSKDTIYNWVVEFTDDATHVMKGYPAHTGDKWVADEMKIDVGGKKIWHWNVMDAETRYVLASHLAKRRTGQEATKTLQKALAAADKPPKTITTDKLPSYIRPIKAVLPGTTHVQSQGIRARINNNLSERLQGTYRDRIRTMRGLDSIETGQRYLDGWTITYNLFREHSGIKDKTPGEEARVDAPFEEWTDVVKSGIKAPKGMRPERPPRKKGKTPRWRKRRPAPRAVLSKITRRAAPVPGQLQLPGFAVKATPKKARPRIPKKGH